MTRRTLTAHGTLTAADAGARTLTYRLLPYGEMGRTSLGAVVVHAGAVTLPTDPGAVVLNLEHDRTSPVGRATSLTEDAAGLSATFAIAPTTRGDDLMAEAAAGLRTGVSVELADPVIRAGVLTAGALTGAGAVVSPAFPSALLVASDTADDDTDDTADDDTAADDDADDAGDDTDTTDATPPGDASDDSDADAADDQEDEMTDTTALTAALGAPGAGGKGKGAGKALTLRAACDLMAAARRGEIGASVLEAALADVIYTGNDAAMPPQWLGEVWDGIAYVRDVVDAIASGPLNSATLNGWKWNPGPVGGDYAGDKTAIPSNAAGIDPVSSGIHRYAVGHDFDRIFTDLGDGSVMEAYWRAVGDDYAAWSNAHATADLVAAAGVALTHANPLTLLVNVATSIKGGPTFIAMSSDVAAELMITDANLPFLAGNLLLSGQGTIAGGGIFIGQELPAATILAGRREAATHLEPSGSPLRVRAVDIAKGGEDGAAFGYSATIVRRPTAFKVGTLL